MSRAAPTDDELARIQQAIGDAADDWIQAHEDEVPFDPPSEGLATDYAQHHAVVSQTPDQLDDFWTKIEAAAAAAEPEAA